MRAHALLLVAILLAGACARRAEPTTPQAWLAASRSCSSGGASDDCYWRALSHLRSGDAAGGIARLTTSCLAGHGRSCKDLAVFYRAGQLGLLADGPKAREYARRSCELGDVDGCSEEAYCLSLGIGGQVDLPRSTTLNERACALGRMRSCRNLGRIVAAGSRDPPDRERAKTLWRLACPAEPDACVDLAYEVRNSDPAEAHRLYELACAHGSGEGCQRSGRVLETTDNLPRALRYYRAACSGGNQSGCDDAARLLLSSGREEDFVEAEQILLRPGERQTPVRRVLLVWARQLAVGPSPARMAEFASICAETGDVEACTMACEVTGQPLDTTPCVAACAGGRSEHCVGADEGLPSPADGGVTAP